MLLGVLGPLEVRGHPAPGPPRDRVVLSALVVRRGSVVAADVLAEALWGDAAPRTWPKVVQGAVVRLRKTLGSEAIVSVAGGYRLDLPASQIDAVVFAEHVKRARAHQVEGDPARAFVAFGDALPLWRGPPLPDLADWAPGRDESARLGELRQMADEERIAAGVAVGYSRDVIADARRLVDEHPERERRWIVLGTALYGAGRQVEALATTREATSRLRDFYGLDPGPELAELELALLRQDPFLPMARATPAASPECPYPGLRAYREADAELFAGRDADVRACLERLDAHGVLVISGASGSGKSSLLHAGLLPVLRDRGHQIVVAGPDITSAESLATSRAGHLAKPVLVIDQFEARFQPDPDSDAARFLDAATDWSDGGHVVLAVRSDHLPSVALSSRFAALAAGGIHLVAPLSGARLREAIESPARRTGLLLESGLVDVLTADIAGEPGGLALLSHALRATWEGGDRDVMTIAGYRATGGVREALARTAESVWSDLDTDQREVTRSLMLRLVSKVGDGAPVAVQLSRQAIADRPDATEIVERLLAVRLVTADNDSITVAHAMLATAWPRLHGWLGDESDDRQQVEHLRVSARGWESTGRPRTELYRGQRLARTLTWRSDTRPVLEPMESAFLDASDGRRRSMRRRLGAALGVAAVALSATLVATTNDGSAPPNVADGEEWLAFTRPDETGLANVFLARPDGSDEHTLLPDRPIANMHVEKPDWSPDGRRVAFEVLGATPGTPAASVWVADADGSSLREVAACANDPCRQFSEPVWSPDGQSLAMVRFDLYSSGECCSSHIEVLDFTTGERRVVFSVAEDPANRTYDVIYSPTWSPDGDEIAFTLERYELDDPYPFIESQVAIVSANSPATQTPRFVSDPDLNAWHPDWHPEQDRIVFSTASPDLFPTGARSEIYEVNADGSGLRQITDTQRDGRDRFMTPTWAPDGETILLSIGRLGSGDVVVSKVPATLSSAGGIPMPIADLRGNDVTLRPIPDD